MHRTLDGRRHFYGHFVMRPTVWTLPIRHQINFDRFGIHYLAHRHQLFVAVDALETEFEAAIAVIFVALEAMTFLEVIVTVAADTNHWTLRANAVGHELICTNMIAADELLNTPEQRSLLLQNVVLHGSITAGIVVTSVREKVYVSNGESHAKAAARERQSVGVNDVHVIGIVSIESDYSISVAEQRLG